MLVMKIKRMKMKMKMLISTSMKKCSKNYLVMKQIFSLNTQCPVLEFLTELIVDVFELCYVCSVPL